MSLGVYFSKSCKYLKWFVNYVRTNTLLRGQTTYVLEMQIATKQIQINSSAPQHPQVIWASQRYCFVWHLRSARTPVRSAWTVQPMKRSYSSLLFILTILSLWNAYLCDRHYQGLEASFNLAIQCVCISIQVMTDGLFFVQLTKSMDKGVRFPSVKKLPPFLTNCAI